MKLSEDTVYNFDVKYEYRTHKYAGRDYENIEMVKKKTYKSFIRSKRRNWNKNQEKYLVCNTYAEWQSHVKSIIRKDMINYEDFLHWLYYMKRDSEKDLQMVKVIQIPIYIGIISLSVPIFNLEYFTFENAIIILLIITGISAIHLINAYNRVYFYSDVIEIAKAEAPPKS